MLRPPYATGANGEPVATSARPSVQRIRSSAVASDFEVGLDSGKMIGRSTLRAISRTIDSLNAPRAVDRPIRIVALIFAITPASPMPSRAEDHALTDRKSTRLNSSHGYISYAVFCL